MKDKKSKALLNSLSEKHIEGHDLRNISPPPKVKRKKLKADLEALPRHSRETAILRKKYIERLYQLIGYRWSAESVIKYIPEIAYELEDDNPPSWRTLFRWRKSFIESDSSVYSLIPNTHRSGNRKKRISNKNQELITLALNQWLKEYKITKIAAFDFYFDKVTLTTNEKPISYQAFVSRINKIPKAKVMASQRGKHVANREFRVISRREKLKRILQCVEIDHTKLDLIVMDDELRTPLGRPWITLLFDRLSDCIVGFYIGFEHPSFVSVAYALKHAILPKHYVKEDYGNDINNEWPCSGIPEQLVTDNGKEFWSKDLDRITSELNISIDFNKVQRPWLKGKVEHIFYTINQSLLTYLPGKTFHNILARGEYNPEQNAVISVSLFIKIFHKWVIDIYHQGGVGDILTIPHEEWTKSYNYFPPLQYQDSEEQLAIICGKSIYRTMQRGGIRLYTGLFYDSEDLVAYRSVTGNRRVLVKYNPDNISEIYVWDDINKYYMVIPTTHPEELDNLTLHQYKMTKRFIRHQNQEKIDIYAIARAREAIREFIAKEIELIKLGRRKSIRNKSKVARFVGVGQGQSGTIIDKNKNKSNSNKSREKITHIDINWKKHSNKNKRKGWKTTQIK